MKKIKKMPHTFFTFHTKQIFVFAIMFCLFSTVRAQTETVVTKKAGQLKKLLKGKENCKSITIIGTLNQKDFLAMSALKNVETLDLSSIDIKESKPFREFVFPDLYKLNKLIIPYLDFSMFHGLYPIDTLVINKNVFKTYIDEYYQENTYFSFFLPYYVVYNDYICINKWESRKDYKGINVFPSVNVHSYHNSLNISGELDLRYAVIVGDYFNGCQITKLILSANIRKLKDFSDCNNLEEVVFLSVPQMQYSPGSFDLRILERFRVPNGTANKFIDMGFPRDKIVDFDGINLTLHVSNPGHLSEMIKTSDVIKVKNLKLTGTIYHEDWEVIKKMKHMETLDLSEVFITKSKEQAEEEYKVSKMRLSILGMSNDAQYERDFDRQGHQIRKRIIDKAKEQEFTYTPKCELPKEAFSGLHLKKLYLPKNLAYIPEGYMNSDEIWCEKGRQKDYFYHYIKKCKVHFY